MGNKACQAKDKENCRYHHPRIEKGLNDYANPEVMNTLLTFNSDCDFANFFLNVPQVEVLRRYTGLGHIPINHFLYDPKGFKESRLARAKTAEDKQRVYKFIEKTEREIALMDEAFNKVVPIRERTVYRYFEIPNTEDVTNQDTVKRTRNRYIKDNFSIGEEVSFSTYLSTSIDSSLMTTHIEGDGANSNIVFEIVTNKGIVPTKTVTDDDSGKFLQDYEREVVLPRNMTFRVKNIVNNVSFAASKRNRNKSQPSNCIVIQLEEI